MHEPFYRGHLSNFNLRGYQATARCPFHEDKRSSFSANVMTGQWICFAGCGHGNHITFARRLGVLSPTPPNITPSVAPVSSQKTPVKSGGGGSFSKRVKEIYTYQYEDGTLAYQVVRFEPKNFAQRRQVNGAWVWGVPKEVRRVVYRLPQILKTKNNEWIYIVEGEKDVHKLESLGLVATTTPMGASNWSSHYSAWFKNRWVAVIPDNDPQGQSYANSVIEDLKNVCGRLKLVRLTGILDKGDVSDYLEMPGDREDALLNLLRDTPELRTLYDDTVTPVEFFARKGVVIRSPDGALPTEFEPLFKESFLATSPLLNGNDAVFSLIEKSDKIWQEGTTPENYRRYLEVLKKAVIESVA